MENKLQVEKILRLIYEHLLLDENDSAVLKTFKNLFYLVVVKH